MHVRIPKTLLKYISNEFAKTFVMTLAIVTAVWVMGSSIVIVRHEILSPSAYFAALPVMAVISLKYSLPMAVLFGASIAYGRMSSENEIRAMEWNGIHVGWIILPAAVVAVAASAVSLALDCQWIPDAHRRLARITTVDVMSIMDRQLSLAARGNKTVTMDEYTLTIGGYDSATRTIQNITVIEIDKERRPIRTIEAPRAAILPGKLPGAVAIVPKDNLPEERRRYVTIQFAGGFVTEYDPQSTMVTTRYAAPPIAIDLSSEEYRSAGLRGMSSSKLAEVARTSVRPQYSREARTDFYERFALGTSPLFFVLLAAPMASLVKWKHNLTAFLPSLAVVMVIYYPLVALATVWGEEGRLNPLYGMFAGNLALLLLSGCAIFLLARR